METQQESLKIQGMYNDEDSQHESHIPDYLATPHLWCHWCDTFHPASKFYKKDRHNKTSLRYCKQGRKAQNEIEQADVEMYRTVVKRTALRRVQKTSHPETESEAWCKDCHAYRPLADFFMLAHTKNSRQHYRRCKYHFLQRRLERSTYFWWFCQTCFQWKRLSHFRILAATSDTFSLNFQCDRCNQGAFDHYVASLKSQASELSMYIHLTQGTCLQIRLSCPECQEYHYPEEFTLTLQKDLTVSRTAPFHL